MDRPDAVGHFWRRCGVPPPAQGHRAGLEGWGTAWTGAGRATGRSIRGHCAGHFAGGASEAAYLGCQRTVCALVICDCTQQTDRRATSARQAGVRQHRRFRRNAPGEAAAETVSASEVAARLESLPARQRAVLQSIAVDSASIRDTAAKYSMSEGAVRVALHRALASLTARLREQ